MPNFPVEQAAIAIPVVNGSAGPFAPSPQAEAFYAESLRRLTEMGVPFLLAGTYAVSAYTGIKRPTKDLDIFAKAGDALRILTHFKALGYSVEIKDERWLAKVHKGDDFFDVIFAASNGTMPIGDDWFEHASEIEVFGTRVRIVGPTEMIWSKAFIQVRHRFDGADVVHLMLKQHEHIDWRRLLAHMEQYWEVLLAHILNFRFIYPSERDNVPGWLMDELLDRLAQQRNLPPPQVKLCRGRMFSSFDYEIAIEEWGFAAASGEGERRHD